jgi:hypothetical protein
LKGNARPLSIAATFIIVTGLVFKSCDEDKLSLFAVEDVFAEASVFEEFCGCSAAARFSSGVSPRSLIDADDFELFALSLS